MNKRWGVGCGEQWGEMGAFGEENVAVLRGDGTVVAGEGDGFFVNDNIGGIGLGFDDWGFGREKNCG